MAENAVDFKTLNGDMVIENGDFAVTESDGQHIEDILIADIGQFRQWPLLGIGILKQQGGNVNNEALKKNIKLQLSSDNFRVKKLTILGGEEMQVEVNATRRR